MASCGSAMHRILGCSSWKAKHRLFLSSAGSQWLSSGSRAAPPQSILMRQRCSALSTAAAAAAASASPSSFAIINHAAAYEQAMQGRHGKQLELAELDAIGKDDPLFDPFAAMELPFDIHADADADSIQEGTFTEKTTQGHQSKNLKEQEQDYEDEDDDEDDDDYDDDDDEDGNNIQTPDEQHYRNDGFLPYKKSQLVKFKAGAPAGGLFCILALGGTQHKVTVDDVIVTERLKPVDHYSVGSIHTMTDNILLVGSTHLTFVGMPLVTGATVKLMVEEITQDAKVIIFKKRRKKNSQRRNGFRRHVTLLRVLDITLPPQSAYSNDNGVDKGNKYVPRVQPIMS